MNCAGHCIHYKPKYIELARRVNDVAPLKFYAVSCQTHPKVCSDQNVKGYPTLKWFPANSDNGEVLPHNPTASKILEGKLNINGEAMGSGKPKGSGSVSKLKEKMGSLKQKQFTKKEKAEEKPSQIGVFHDASLSFDFSLRNAIFMTNGPLKKNEAKVFKQWLETIHRIMPITMENVKNDAATLMLHFDEVKESEENLISYLSTDPSAKWTENCAKGDVGGYTCGLWEFFHIYAQALVQWNNVSQDRIATSDAADLLKDYIENFFACDECRKNFLQMYDACQFSRCDRLSFDITEDAKLDWKQLPLWLWETHNDVNVRLLNEERKDNGLSRASVEEEQDARWPSKKQCEECWLDGGGWDENKVYDYLQSYYWPSNSVFDAGTTAKKIRFHDASATSQISSRLLFSSISLIILGVLLLFVWKQKSSGHQRQKSL